jgi:hypothetical protein
MVAAILGLAAWLSCRGPEALETTDLSATGELLAYDAARRDLTLRTATGDRHFVVGDRTPVHEGTKALEIASLTKATHCRVKVWYGVGSTRMVVREVRVSCEAARAAIDAIDQRQPVRPAPR